MKRSRFETPRSSPGKASKYFRHFKKMASRGIEVVVYCRVSSRTQIHRRSLDRQEQYLREKVKKLGGRVIEVFREIGSGWIIDADERKLFVQACRIAVEQGAIVVARSSDRFIRNEFFGMHGNIDALPTRYEFRQLR